MAIQQLYRTKSEATLKLMGVRVTVPIEISFTLTEDGRSARIESARLTDTRVPVGLRSIPDSFVGQIARTAFGHIAWAKVLKKLASNGRLQQRRAKQ